MYFCLIYMHFVENIKTTNEKPVGFLKKNAPVYGDFIFDDHR